MKHLLFIIAFFNLCFCAAAQKVTISTMVDKETILIGEQFILTIQTDNLPPGAAWLTIDTLPHFEILEKSKVDSTITGNQLSLKQTYTLTSWDSGSWQLLSALPSGISTKFIRINVGHSPMDYTQDYHDVKDIMEVEKPGRTTWYWYLIGLLLLVLLFLLFFPRGAKKPKPDFVPDATIYQQSLKKLEALRGKSGDDAKAFHTELVAIFREYLRKRKGIQSYSKTTDDIAVQISSLQISNNIFQPMLQTLRLSDLAKFARANPASSENERSIDIIKQSINAIEEAR
jgi:hypothetical protein